MQSKQGKKKALLTEIEAMVDEMLEWEEQNPAPTLTEIEEAVLKLRRQVSQRVAEFLLERQEGVRPVDSSNQLDKK